MEAPGVYVVGKAKFEAIFICSPRSQPFRFSRSRGRAVSSVQHVNKGIDTGDDQKKFLESERIKGCLFIALVICEYIA